jgi:hypothetical protein
MNRSAWVEGGECELGDLLIVHDHTKDDGSMASRRAVLVQAKMPHATGNFADNPRQSFLYENWPTFWITKPATFDKRAWDLDDNSQGARYAQITPGAPRRRWLRAQSPWAFISCAGGATRARGDDMAAFLVRMLDFDNLASRGRCATSGGTDDWSALIDEMLNRMKVREFTNRQLLGGKHRGPRVVSAFAGNHAASPALQFVCSGAVPAGGGGKTGAEPIIPEGAGPGISTILIETSVRSD